MVDAWAPYGLGYTVPRPFHWSNDGRYLFVTNDPAPDGCALFVNGSDLQRVDLSNGEVTQIVEPVGLWLSLSPDETKLAYLSWEGRPTAGRARLSEWCGERDQAAGRRSQLAGRQHRVVAGW